MKKALALVLALVLALSMAVSALAITVLPLVPTAPAARDGRLDLSKEANQITFTDLGTVSEVAFVATYHGGVYYMLVNDADLKNVAVSATGALEAKVVKYDPETMKGAEVNYTIVEKADKEENDVTADAEALLDAKAVEKVQAVIDVYGADSYQAVKAVADEANKVAKYQKYVVLADAEYSVVVLTVEPNYSVNYKVGTFKITADRVIDKKTSVAVASDVYYVYSDVVIFEYEEVKWAANNDGELVINEGGYSAFIAGNYGDDEYVVEDLRNEENATVVSTTAFRAIAGKDLVVAVDDNNYVTLKAIAAGQKGVNFAYDGYYYLNAAGKDVRLASTLDKQIATIEFGFLGDQVVKGDFEITLNPGMDWFQVRELFGIEVEEEDIITYYILKDGKVIDSITVDYMTVDLDEEIELVIKGSNSTLGWYAIALEVPAVEEAETEENPNTGAESVVGVVAALAVVSVATAAAVSLKK